MSTQTAAAGADSAVHPYVQPVIDQLRFSQMAMHLNLEGITHEESLRAPAGGGNCLNWVLGHLVAARQGWLSTVLGERPVLDLAVLAPYRRGSSPLDPAHALRFEDLVAAYDASQAPLLAALARLTPERMAQPAPFSPGRDPNETVGSLVAKLSFHEGYHSGQLAVLRRTVGHPGGIA